MAAKLLFMSYFAIICLVMGFLWMVSSESHPDSIPSGQDASVIDAMARQNLATTLNDTLPDIRVITKGPDGTTLRVTTDRVIIPSDAYHIVIHEFNTIRNLSGLGFKRLEIRTGLGIKTWDLGE